jgi:hypothetical protein
MTDQPWHAIQQARGQEITLTNPLELGHPFRLTDEQRARIEPYLCAAGKDGAVLIVLSKNEKYENFLRARPIALQVAERKAIRATLTKAIRKQNNEQNKQ